MGEDQPPLPLPPLPKVATPSFQLPPYIPHKLHMPSNAIEDFPSPIRLPPIYPRQPAQKLKKRVLIRYSPNRSSIAIVSRILERAADDPLVRVLQGSDEKYRYISLIGEPEDIREVLGTEVSNLAHANEETMRQSRRSTYPNSNNKHSYQKTQRPRRVENSLLKKTLKHSFERAIQENRSKRLQKADILPKHLEF